MAFAFYSVNNQMHSPGRVKFSEFGTDSLSSLSEVRQAQYLADYFDTLDASVVLEEPGYFDRDYLSEFAAFYSVSSRGYLNICRRLHFFSDSRVCRRLFRQAVGGSSRSSKVLQDCYLGFVVLRPIPAAPLGRTVVRWYPERLPATPRITSPSRDYICHVGGVDLVVHGLAWQQQDTGVSACATVGIWSMLHSSAFDDHHAVPTTVAITEAAHRTASLGARVFPSAGLRIEQLLEAIKENKLAPVVISGEHHITTKKGAPIKAFGRERIASSLASLIRSGYPVLIVGRLGSHGYHAVCGTGFRSAGSPITNPGTATLQDSNTDHFYIHDDNLGPNVRFRLVDKPGGFVALITDPPTVKKTKKSPTTGYPEFVPEHLIVAVHEDLRTSPDFLHSEGLSKATGICRAINALLEKLKTPAVGVTFSTRFMKLHEYIGPELGRLLGGDSKILAQTRLFLCENAPPMSLHIGIVRVALHNSTPLIDILYDTTDIEKNKPVFASVSFNKAVFELSKNLPANAFGDFGYPVLAA